MRAGHQAGERQFSAGSMSNNNSKTDARLMKSEFAVKPDLASQTAIDEGRLHVVNRVSTTIEPFNGNRAAAKDGTYHLLELT
jgi:hypothetical protein